MNIAVFCSGNGSNLQAIIDSVKSGILKAKIKFVLCDKKEAYCLKRAKEAGLKTVVIDPKVYKTREAFDKEAIKHIEKEKVQLIVLAGFMRILSDHFVRKYDHKILNIHPSLLPSFKGANGIRDAFNSGVKLTGVTIHFVNEKLDSGPILLQDVVKIESEDTLETLEAKIHKLEHRLYPKAIAMYIQGKF
jgi:phosphoribosylglycinamide formyltransferase-1